MEGEEWRDVVGYEGLYMVSDYGRVKSLDRVIERKNGKLQTWKGKVLKAKKYNSGYFFVHLSSPKEILCRSIHRLVALSFIDNPHKFPIINHIDENRKNNCAYNLEWCTQKYNCNYGNHYEKYIETLAKNGYLKKVYQFSLDGHLIEEYPSIQEATDKTGINNISAVCLGKYCRAGNYLWSFSSTPPKLQYGKTSARFVCFLDDDGNVISQYSSLREAARAHNTFHNQISSWCRSNNPHWKIKYE